MQYKIESLATSVMHIHSFRPAPLPTVEEGGTLVFQFAKDKGYKDIARSLQNNGCASAICKFIQA